MTLRTWRRRYDRHVRREGRARVVQFGRITQPDPALRAIWDLADYYVNGTDGTTFYLRPR